VIVAQISDPHVSTPGARIFGGYAPEPALERTIAAVAGLGRRPDLVLFTGDLTENGTAEEYAHFRTLVADLGLPAAAIPGNHDRRAAFEAGLAGSGIATGALPFLQLELEAGPLRLIGLDTLAEEGGAAGLLCRERLEWVAARLAEAPERPTLIFMHHPPFATGIAAMDAIGCANGDLLAAIVRRHPQVLGVTCGHVHRAVATVWAGRAATVAPAVAWEVPPNFSHNGPTGLVPQAPGFLLHLWTPEAGLVTHAEVLAQA
jgi:3',5'-cyclic-AMP phosphodiesterase